MHLLLSTTTLAILMTLIGCKAAGTRSRVKEIGATDASGKIWRFAILDPGVTSGDDAGSVHAKICNAKSDTMDKCRDANAPSVPWSTLKTKLTTAWQLNPIDNNTPLIMMRVKSWLLPAKDPVADLYTEDRFSDAGGKARFQELTKVLNELFNKQPNAADNFFGEVVLGPASNNTATNPTSEKPVAQSTTSPESPPFLSLDFTRQPGDFDENTFANKRFKGTQILCTAVDALAGTSVSGSPSTPGRLCSLEIEFHADKSLIFSTGNNTFNGQWNCLSNAQLPVCGMGIFNKVTGLRNAGDEIDFRAIKGRLFMSPSDDTIYIAQSGVVSSNTPCPPEICAPIDYVGGSPRSGEIIDTVGLCITSTTTDCSACESGTRACTPSPAGSGARLAYVCWVPGRRGSQSDVCIE